MRKFKNVNYLKKNFERGRIRHVIREKLHKTDVYNLNTLISRSRQPFLGAEK